MHVGEVAEACYFDTPMRPALAVDTKKKACRLSATQTIETIAMASRAHELALGIHRAYLNHLRLKPLCLSPLRPIGAETPYVYVSINHAW